MASLHSAFNVLHAPSQCFRMIPDRNHRTSYPRSGGLWARSPALSAVSSQFRISAARENLGGPTPSMESPELRHGILFSVLFLILAPGRARP